MRRIVVVSSWAARRRIAAGAVMIGHGSVAVTV